MEKLKYIMYCRKSTVDSEDRQIQSINDQKEVLEKEVANKNLKIVKVFGESQSAKDEGRPMFNEMMDMIQQGKADGIICWKINRLTRNPVDGGKIQHLLQKNILKSIITIGREYLPGDNVLIMSVELGMANQFILDLSKDVKRGMNSKVSKGWRPHTAPLGYINDKHGLKGEKRIFKDPDRFDLIRKMWDMMLTGQYSVKRVVEEANEVWGLRTRQRKRMGGVKLCLSTGYKLFTNTFYYGEYMYNGELQQGKHDPMITKQEFDRVQKILGKKGKPRPRIKRLPFNGLIVCGECGGMITSEEKTKFIKSTQKYKNYIYHHCSKRKKDIKCYQKVIRHEDLKEQILQYLDSITIPEEFLHWSLEVLRDNNKIEKSDRDKILKNLQKNYNQCIGRIDNLIKLYISPDNTKRALLSEEEYKQQKNSLMAEKSELNSKINNIEQRLDQWIELTEKTFNFATYAKYWFEKGDFETKTNILRCLGQNFSLTNQKLHIELRKPFLTIKKSLESKHLQKARLEPKLYIINKGVSKRNRTTIEMWSG